MLYLVIRLPLQLVSLVMRLINNQSVNEVQAVEATFSYLPFLPSYKVPKAGVNSLYILSSTTVPLATSQQLQKLS